MDKVKEIKIKNQNFNRDLTKEPEIKLEMTSTRHCALCYKSLTSNDLIVPCSGGGCKGKRVYCSDNCREKDWTPRKPQDFTVLPAKLGAEKYTTAAVLGLTDVDDSVEGWTGQDLNEGQGQGHSSWCDVPCCQEDVDWVLDTRGLVALKNIPSKSRILVEGFKIGVLISLIKTGGRVGVKSVVKPYLTRNLKALTRLRSYLPNHSCDANAAKVIDEDYLAIILYAKRDISPGDEITVNYTLYSEIYSINPKIPNFQTESDPKIGNKHRSILESKYGIICLPSCLCQTSSWGKKLKKIREIYWLINDEAENSKEMVADQDQEGKVMKNDDFLSKFIHSQGQSLNDDFISTFIPTIFKLHDELHGNWFQKAILLDAAFLVGIKQSKNLHLAVEWIKEAFEIWSSILHPQGRFAKRDEIFMKDPTLTYMYGVYDHICPNTGN